MSKFLKYFLHRAPWQKLPMMNRMYSSEFKSTDVDQDTQTLMRLTHTRCPQGVEILKKRHGLNTARALIEQLPQRKRKRRIMARALSLIQISFGLTSYDPMKALAHEHMRRTRRDGRR